MKFGATIVAIMAGSAAAQLGAQRYTHQDMATPAVDAKPAAPLANGNKQVLGAARYTHQEQAAPAAVEAKPAAPLAAADGKRKLADGWYVKDDGENQHPENIVGDGEKFTMTVGPDANSCKILSTQTYNGGRFEVKMTSASKMPGVITAIYLASGEGRKGDEALGDQDEIDFEFKGSEPMQVQTNVFLSGEEDLKVIEVGKDTSAEAMAYAIEWDNTNVNFFIENENVRTVATGRALKPLKLSISVWTTMGGWPGLIKWAGETNWGAANGPVAAEFEVVSLPDM